MKMIKKIARAELQTMFYSPVAWLILVIFAFQIGMVFSQVVSQIVNSQELGNDYSMITYILFSGSRGVYTAVQQYLYLYIPLLTMGLMSKELSNGSIKLLYSSPVKNVQIILGKYLSVMLYGLILMSILAVIIVLSALITQSLDVLSVLAGLFGLYLLLCAYAAIGLFMSSLTSYQVVAAIGTFAILSALNYVGGLWQKIEIVRDITYWLSIRGRAGGMVNGLMCSEDVLYFFIVVALFLFLTVIRLQARRQKTRWYVTCGKYLGVVLTAMLLGYVTSRPVCRFTWDTTHTQWLTITPNSQEIIKNIEGELTITTYANVFDDNWIMVNPHFQVGDSKRFNNYARFKPDIKMKYVYYYDSLHNPGLEKRYPELSYPERMKKVAMIHKLDTALVLTPEQIRERIDLKAEGRKLVRQVEAANGQRTFLRFFDDPRRHPDEAEISAAFKSLISKAPAVGFLTGHGERDARLDGDRNYKRFAEDRPFRYSLINQGFTSTDVSLEKDVPDEIDILVIADARIPFDDEEKERLNRYIEKGGNLLIAGEPRRQDVLNPLTEQLGVTFMPGRLVKPTVEFQADFIASSLVEEGAELTHFTQRMYRKNQVVTTPGVTGLSWSTDKGFKVTPVLRSDSLGVWNELQTTDFLDDTVSLDETTGEKIQTYITAIALSREIAGKEQRIFILGDADYMSNSELGMQRRKVNATNHQFMTGIFYWLSRDEMPIDTRRPPHKDIRLYAGPTAALMIKLIFMGLLPLVMAVYAVYIWLKRRGR